MSHELEQVRSTVIRVSHLVDRKDWSALRALYADEVETDYTSLFGGAPERRPSDEVVDGWRQALTGISTQHLLGPVDAHVEGAFASAECHVRAWHQARGAPGGDEWVVGGHYVFALARSADGWRITRMKLETLHQTGNLELLRRRR